jgi:hypothetical protein
MFKKAALIVTILASPILLGVAVIASTNDVTPSSGLTVHEWGTFTSVAGVDGKAVPWLPLGGPNDLPCFVDYYQNRLYKVFGPIVASRQTPVDYNNARGQLLGPIRMETPVVYFYSSKRQVVNVRVAFPQGFVTEWFPKAVVDQTPVRTGALEKNVNTGATIKWSSVEILPRDSKVIFPRSSGASHYYAARNTDANPLRVKAYDEKFLFYRGVGGFPVPINARVTADGKVNIKHLTGKPSVILFESRGGKLGYTVVDTSTDQVSLDLPPLTADFEALRHELESVLVAQGLYEKEAKAMLDTWRDSWFEEGTRVFYIVPPTMVETILPLTVEPKPKQVARVFVGRVELFTPATIEAVENAIATNNTEVVNTYGRFLGPIMERIPAAQRDANGTAVLNAAFRKYVEQAGSCRK